MGRSPVGVAMGVSGDAQTQAEHPGSQVPMAFGTWHLGGPLTGPGTVQQISPAVQQSLPQQEPPAPQVCPLQGGVPHVPRLQYGFGPLHLLPHVPQLLMSFFRLTQAPPQQPKPGIVHFVGSQPPPELELDELDVLVLLDELAPVDDEALDELAPLDELAALEELAPLEELALVDALVELDALVLLEEEAPPVELDAVVEPEVVVDSPPMPPPEVIAPLELVVVDEVVVGPCPPMPEELVVDTPPPQRRPRIAATHR
jgi:hypothetical protein